MTAPLRYEHPFGREVPVYPPEAQEERIARIVAGFDADRVHRCMELVGWIWGGSDMPKVGVPTAEQIRMVAADLLRRTAAGFTDGSIPAGGGWQSGGLVTTVSPIGELHLHFELCQNDETAFGVDDEEPAPVGFLSVGDPRTWRKS